MTGIFITILQVVACFGFGAAGLRILGVGTDVPSGERHVLAFCLGMGTIGWLYFSWGLVAISAT